MQEPDGKPGNDFIGLNHYARCSRTPLLCKVLCDEHIVPAKELVLRLCCRVYPSSGCVPNVRRAVVNWMLQPDKKGPEKGGLSQMVRHVQTVARSPSSVYHFAPDLGRLCFTRQLHAAPCK